MMKLLHGVACILLMLSQQTYADTLTLSSAVQRLTQHPQWQVAQALLAQAQGEVTVAGQYLNPSIELLGETQDKQSVTLVLSVETPSVRHYRQRSAGAALDQTTQQALWLQQQLFTQLMVAFYRITEKTQAQLLAKEELQLLERLRHAVQLKVTVGELPRYEGVKAEAEWLASQTRVNTASQQLAQAKQALAHFLGIQQLTDVALIHPDDAKLCQVAQQSSDSYLATYPLYQAAKAKLIKAQADTAYEQALVTPQPTLSLGQEREPGIERTRLGVSIPLPLFNQRDGQIATAKAKQQQSDAELREVERQFQQDWSNALLRYQSAQMQLHSYDAGLLSEATTAFNVAQVAYTYGERSILDLIDAQRTLARVKQDYLEFQFEQRYACLDMQQLANIHEVLGDE